MPERGCPLLPHGVRAACRWSDTTSRSVVHLSMERIASPNRLRQVKALTLLAAQTVGAVVLAGCASEPRSDEPSASAPPPTSASSSTSTAGRGPSSGVFDSLSVTLSLHASEVRQGKTLRSTLTFENGSRTVVTDPACLRVTGSHALVPVDEPDAELWMRSIVDCLGDLKMPPGYTERIRAYEFYARTKYGEPLPPGEYLAVIDLQGQRLEQPVTITR